MCLEEPLGCSQLTDAILLLAPRTPVIDLDLWRLLFALCSLDAVICRLTRKPPMIATKVALTDAVAARNQFASAGVTAPYTSMTCYA